jgi:PIN domain nuclease of toxin-antitoxin system
VKYLVDTNAWIALFENSPELTDAGADLMESAGSECFVSIASIWEAAIKVGLGKLKLPYDLAGDLPGIMEDNGFEILPVEFADAAGVRDLEQLHGDPFDRVQAVQARRRGFSMISRDPVFDRYGIRRIW